ncbi:Mg2+ transporter protein, CorA family protein [Magnetococcus marinus MC-1]|uniref:Mg2+ transporter protein, CorA family protein n=1 Tax=Magnetococcus marinus (strain ATCC BAA-1437 / JCM 17883 / MC-1) TaxID=156889 RepID=A0LAN7_MAGMM|nr:zinc transporter ZntB [Magnetococcus marinus]ABK45030.1 Mg2+ transporter protein, CorA family protein [Magnetococcus marinus MC-1]
MDMPDGLIHALLFDGKGGGTLLDGTQLATWRPEQGFLWLHWKLDSDGLHRWMNESSHLDPVVGDVLNSTENHPRLIREGDSLLGTLRGLNFNQQSEPEDMVFVNIYIDNNRAITARRDRVMTIHDIALDLQNNCGPMRPGGFLATILDSLHARMEPLLGTLEEELDLHEQALLMGEGEKESLREELLMLRRKVINLRRYLAPQKIALALLSKSPPSWLNKGRTRQIREVEHELQRYLGDLESYRERAVVIREEINNQMNVRMNRAMYMLSLITGIFLPLGFLTGLLGINVGGMPGADNPWAFWLVCLLMIAVTAINLFVFYRKKLL